MSKGADWYRNLPDPTFWGTQADRWLRLQQREAAVLARLGSQPVTWQHVEVRDAVGNSAWFAVSADALMIDGLRVATTHRTAELIARTLCCHLLTPRLADALHAQATAVIGPRIQSPCTASNAAVIRHSEACDVALTGKHGLVSGTGKHWVNCAGMHKNKTRGYNYGWHAKGAPHRAATPEGGRLWQPLASAHTLDHVDYSQTLRVMHGRCTVNGQEMLTRDVVASPLLWRLLSHEGPLELGHPGVDGPAGEEPGPMPEAPPKQWWTDGPHAANYYPETQRRGFDLIVIHSSEAAEKPYTAEALAAWAAGKSGPAPEASWHWAVDCDSAVRCCPESLVAWHANGANRWAIGIEHAGYARQSREDWLDAYSEPMLRLSARVVRELLVPRYSVPVRRVPIDALRLACQRVRAGAPYPDEARGLCAHSDLVRAGWGGNHGDPGAGFPWDWYLAECSRG